MKYVVNHKHRQIYVLNLLKNTLVKLLQPRGILTFNYPVLSWLSQLSYLFSKGLSKLPLGLIVVLLPYSVNTQALSALSATTAEVINGSEPYLTFDGGVTKVTTTDALLGITLSDGTAITPENNTSATTPIELPTIGETLVDVQMLVPTTTDSIALNDLIGAPYNYWGDDDGDGQGVNGITASGSLSVSITDNMGNQVSRSATLDICKSPYKVALTSTDGSLTTQYGVPNSSNFSGDRATYYISPKATPKICYARPNQQRGDRFYSGPETVNIWKKDKGFLVQSTESSTYSRNFPTTGANNLYFDLLAGGIDASTLTWPAVTKGGITATMTLNPPFDWYFNSDGASSVRVTLTGPAATIAQINLASLDKVATPTLPQTFELVGYDSNNKAVVKYGFVLKQWFVIRRDKHDTYHNNLHWCNLTGGYRMPKVKDLTNAKCDVNMYSFPCVDTDGVRPPIKDLVDGAKPSSNINNYHRNIGAGFFTEWGEMDQYIEVGIPFVADFWVKEGPGEYRFDVSSSHGGVTYGSPDSNGFGICVYP